MTLNTPTILAQGGIGEGTAPLCEMIGFGFLFVLLAAVVAIVIRFVLHKRNAIDDSAPLYRRLVAVIAVSVVVIVLCVVNLEGWSTHAWRNRSHTWVIRAIDERTGEALPIQSEIAPSYPDSEDPFIQYSLSPDNPEHPHEMRLTSNIDLPLTVWSGGYEVRAISVTGDTPELMVVPLRRATTMPTTIPG